MKRPLALLRPEPGWSDSAAAARDAGLEVVGHPLFAVEAVPWAVPLETLDALLAGSAAAFRYGGPNLAALRHLPVYAVGEATAEAAREAGFEVVLTGSGGLQAVLDDGPKLRFLRLGGEERVDLAPQPSQSVTERTAYRLTELAIAPSLASDLAVRSPLVALHSAAAARHFAAEIDRLDLERGKLFLLALGPRIAKDAGLGWAAVHLADMPSDVALLAKAAALCK